MERNGKPKGAAGRAIYTDKMMTAEQCAEIVLKAAEKRKREVLMWPGPLAVWLKMLAPGLVDWINVQAVLRPMAKRARGKQ